MPTSMLCSTVLGGDVDQVAAVVDLLDLHARRQDAGGVDLLHLGFDALDGGHALFAAPHQDDALDDVVVVVLAGDAQARLVAHRHVGDVAQLAPARRCWTPSMVLRISSIEWIRPTPRTTAACVPEIDRLAADIDVAVVQRLQHLRQGQAVDCPACADRR